MLRAFAIAIAMIVVSFGPIGIAASDPWKTTTDVVLRKKPGEKQAVVAKLPAGTVVVIEKEEGRWMRVRAGKYVGYLTRTTIADQAPPPPPPPPPAEPAPAVEPAAPPPQRPQGPAHTWSAARVKAKAGGTGLFVSVTTKSTTLFAEPKANAAKVAEAAQGDQLAVVETVDPAWIHVRNGDGRDAWVARRDVDNAGASVALASTGPVAELDSRASDGPQRAAPKRLAIRADAAIGYRSLGMDFSSDGSAGLANYLVSADALAAEIAGDAAMRLSPRLRAGFDARVQISTSSPGSGIDYTGPSEPSGKITFRTFATDLGARIGVRAHRVLDVALHGGLHYDAFLTGEIANAGRLPRELLVGATLGARVDIVPPSSRISAVVRFDMLVIGHRGQTAGLEDGASSTAHAMWGGAAIRILLDHRWSLGTGIDVTRATTDWEGMSVRAPGTTRAHRVDSSQVLQIGLGAEL